MFFNNLVDEVLTTVVAWPRPKLIEGKPLYLYGNGKLGKLAQDFFSRIGVKVDAVFDSNKDTAWPDTNGQVAVCITNFPYGPIEKNLNRHGYIDIAPFYDLANNFVDRHPLANGWFQGPLNEYEQQRTMEVFVRWGDEISRAHHLQFIAWRRLREERLFDWAPVTNKDQHLIPEVVNVLHDHEVFFDGGAYHGEISLRFKEHVDGRFDKIIVVEPDDENRAVLLKKAPNRTRIISYALAAKDGPVGFAKGFGYTSKIWWNENYLSEGRTIDSLDVTPTFIKLHLEGGELGALKGARKTLLKCRPIVTANLDHNSDGIYRTAEYLMELLQGYKFLFRNHTYCAGCSIVYAIPMERYR